MGETTVAWPQSPITSKSSVVSAQAWELAAVEGKKGRSGDATKRTTTEDPITGPVQAGLYTVTPPAGSCRDYYSHAAYWKMEAPRGQGVPQGSMARSE